MGHKVHPTGFRIGVIRDWDAKWYADRHYREYLQEDIKIRKVIRSLYPEAGVSTVEIDRQANNVAITVHTARPGILIGRGGQRVDELRARLEKLIDKRVQLNIREVPQPEMDAYLVARNVADQMERRISYRRTLKQALLRTIQAGAKGMKISCAGRLDGAEIARRVTMHEGQVPLHTLRADIDYGFAEAKTSMGRVGVKVWLYKGEILPPAKETEEEEDTGPAIEPVEEAAEAAVSEAAVAEAPAAEAAPEAPVEQVAEPEPVVAEAPAVEATPEAEPVVAETAAEVPAEEPVEIAEVEVPAVAAETAVAQAAVEQVAEPESAVAEAPAVEATPEAEPVVAEIVAEVPTEEPAVAEAEPPTEEPPAPEPQKPATRRRTRTPKAAATEVTAEAVVEEPAEAPAGEPAAPKKPATRRRTKATKSEAAATEAAAAKTAADEAPAQAEASAPTEEPEAAATEGDGDAAA
jgi:small subunit ribosomal protein S3